MKPLKHPLQTKRDQALDAAALKRQARHQRAQAKYKQTAKGKATDARWNRSPKRLAAQARYLASDKGQRVKDRHNGRRLFVGRYYHGLAQTIEQATVIQHHIKERVREFKQRFSDREEAESVPPCEVSPQTTV